MVQLPDSVTVQSPKHDSALLFEFLPNFGLYLKQNKLEKSVNFYDGLLPLLAGRTEELDQSRVEMTTLQPSLIQARVDKSNRNKSFLMKEISIWVGGLFLLIPWGWGGVGA